MFSWLNFEELLIHNPIELINPSKDTISVAMNKKQYIEFFSNKYTYNGLYYDEEMDFCMFYYADPLQSYKEGDVYAQGYIDVEMKIYRVKWLCNVSISFPSGLLQSTDGTQGVPQEDGKYTHTAWSYSADGTNGFTTVYPNLNLLKNTIITQESLTPKNWSASVGSLLSVGSNNGIKVVNNGGIIGSTGGFGYGPTVNVKAGDTITVSYYVKNTGAAEIKNFSLQIAFYGSSNTYPGNDKLVIPNDGKPYFFSFTTTVPNGASTARPRWLDRATAVNEQHIFEVYGMKTEQGSTATPHMPSASEVTTADWPSYIGQYTDYALEDSTNPSSYTWREIQEDKWNVTKTEMVVNPKTKAITTVLNGALAKCTKDKNITGWNNSQPDGDYNYRQPQYSLDIGSDDFIISGFGLRGLKNG